VNREEREERRGDRREREREREQEWIDMREKNKRGEHGG
jgi:hypothetical protein